MPEADQAMRAKIIWSGTVSFGLVSLPVNLVPAVREERISFRMLAPDGTPLARTYFCPEDGVDVSSEHTLRGYEIKRGEYIPILEEELEALFPEKTRDIDLRQFVKISEVDPILFERGYFLVPGSGASKAYRLLAETMEKSKRAGIATFVMREKEYLIAIVAENGILRAETLRFNDEIRSPQDVGVPKKKNANKSSVTRLQKSIEKLSKKSFDPNAMTDKHRERLLEIIEAKDRAGKDVVEVDVDVEDDQPVINLMEALKRSLKESPKNKKERGSVPVSDYDALTAAQVKEAVGDLGEAKIRQLKAYEHKHKDRKTVKDVLEKRLQEIAGT